MKKTILTVGLTMLALVSSTIAQAPASKTEEELLQLVKDVQAQQAQIADNQSKIEAKLAEVSEAVRQARIFSGREK